jgi:hypothetical protein
LGEPVEATPDSPGPCERELEKTGALKTLLFRRNTFNNNFKAPVNSSKT